MKCGFAILVPPHYLFEFRFKKVFMYILLIHLRLSLQRSFIIMYDNNYNCYSNICFSKKIKCIQSLSMILCGFHYHS